MRIGFDATIACSRQRISSWILRQMSKQCVYPSPIPESPQIFQRDRVRRSIHRRSHAAIGSLSRGHGDRSDVRWCKLIVGRPSRDGAMPVLISRVGPISVLCGGTMCFVSESRCRPELAAAFRHRTLRCFIRSKPRAASTQRSWPCADRLPIQADSREAARAAPGATVRRIDVPRARIAHERKVVEWNMMLLSDDRRTLPAD